MMQKLNNVTFRHEFVQKLLRDMRILQQWKSMRKPTFTVRYKMMKLCRCWEVFQRSEGDLLDLTRVSAKLEACMLERAEEIVEGNDCWQILHEFATWVKQHCTRLPNERENEALTALLSLIESFPCSTSNNYRLHNSGARSVIMAELGALRPLNKNRKQVQQPRKLCQYAFVQHALRELRAHTSLWSSNLKSTAPKGFAGRAGYEHCFANVGDVITMQAHWPFHLAGDSAAWMFGHRAWLSWRYFVLLELPELSLWQLPVLSSELQHLIEQTRCDAQPVKQFNAHAVEEVLLSFFHDSSGSYAKARWLRRAMKLELHCDDSDVEELLQLAVADCFVLLQSRALVSARYIACVALFLFLQSHRKP